MNNNFKNLIISNLIDREMWEQQTREFSFKRLVSQIIHYDY